MKVVLALLAACVAVASGRFAYQLPAGVELLTTQIITSFSCLGRPYGYYADVQNDCAFFHVCVPVTDEIGNIVEEAHFSFMCGNRTVFSQESLSCSHLEEAYPCNQAESLFDATNADFGKIPDIS